MSSIIDDIKGQFSYGNMVSRLIIANVIVFVIAYIIKLGFTIGAGFSYSPYFQSTVVEWLSLHSSAWYTLTHPWTLITSMFFHQGLWHIVFNMLMLFWFGRIVGDLIGDQRMLPLYILCGLAGAALYLALSPIVNPNGSLAYGASAAVMGIAVIAAMLNPDYRMHLLIIGEVRLKYVVLALVFLDLVSIAGLSNTGGHIAHLGGALFGVFYVWWLRHPRGSDVTQPVQNLVEWIENTWSNLWNRRRKSYTPPQRKAAFTTTRSNRSTPGKVHKGEVEDGTPFQDKLDTILDKIKVSGYESLTAEERAFLFKASNQ